MTTFTWTGSTGGWGTSTNWQPTTTPNDPAADALIDSPGSYTVTVETGTTYAINTVSLGNDTATLDVQGTLAFGGKDNILDIAAGTLLLDQGGVLAGATILAGGTGTFDAAGGTLNGATYRGDLLLNELSDLTIVGGLTAEDASGSLPGTISLSGDGASLTIGDTETLDNLVLSVSGVITSIAASGGPVTLGTNATLTLSTDFGLFLGDLVNQGSIQLTSGFFGIFSSGSAASFSNLGQVTIGSGTLSISSDSFANTGTIDILADGDLSISADTTFSNAGGLTLEAGGTLSLAGSLTLAQLQSYGITGNGGALNILGTLDLQGATLDLASSGLFDDLVAGSDGVSFGTITNGIIITSGHTLNGTGGTLSDVAVIGPFELGSGANLNTAESLIVQGDTSGAAGTVIVDSFAVLSVQSGLTLGSAGNPGTILVTDDDASVTFANGGSLDHLVFDLRGSSDLIIAPGPAVFLASDVTANLSGGDVEFQGNFVNQGMFSITAGNAFAEDLDPSTSFINLSTINIGAANFTANTDIFTNVGLIDIGDGGQFSVSGTTAFGDAGQITIETGGTLVRFDPTTLASLTSGHIVNSGGTLVIGGPLDLQGGTLDISASNLFSHLQLAAGGTIANGTIEPNGGEFSNQGGTFSNILFQGDLVIDNSATLNTVNGLTVTDTTGSQPGTVTLGFGADLSVSDGLMLGAGGNPGSIAMSGDFATLEFQTSQQLDDVSFAIGGYIDQVFARSGILTIGPSTVLQLSTSFGFAYGNLVNMGSIGQSQGFFDLLNNSPGDIFDNQGAFTIDSGQFFIDEDNFTNEGTVAVGSGGLLNISATTTFSSTGLILVGGSGTLEIAPTTSADVTFSSQGLLILDSPADYVGTLHGLATDDAIQFTGQTITSAMITGTTLVANLEGGGTLGVSVTSGLEGLQFLVQSGSDGNQDQLVVLPCFRTGTRILTDQGPMPVERLHEGDAVVTAFGRTRTIRWIGRRKIDCRRHPHPQAIQPIRVQAHAFGRGRPARDLYLSPDHAVFVEDVLIPIKYLQNGSTIRQIASRVVEYFHVELESHDVICAEGLSVESYLDTGDRAAFENAGAEIQLHPSFGQARIEAQLLSEALSVARLVIAGEEVERVRRALRRQSQRRTRRRA